MRRMLDVRSIVPVSPQSQSASVRIHHFGDSGGAGSPIAGERSDLPLDIDKNLFEQASLESRIGTEFAGYSLYPGIAADSNGLFHGIGDHASNSFSIDGQPITDQQSKVFSNQLPVVRSRTWK